MWAMHRELESMLEMWQVDDSLLEATSFSARVEILDELDRCFAGQELLDLSSDRNLADRARAFADRLNSANEDLFASTRKEIQRGICPSQFEAILNRDRPNSPDGIAYDHLDDLLAGVLRLDKPTEAPRVLGPDSVFYQPTPARHIFQLINAACIGASDTLIDLGSGLGHVSLLTSICTGATAIGIELDPVWVQSARKCADRLNLNNVEFLVQDAREADLSSGTVFYLYTPFTGATLASVLQALRRQAAMRPIRVCTFGPCTLSIAREPWLKLTTPVTADQIAVFNCD